MDVVLWWVEWGWVVGVCLEVCMPVLGPQFCFILVEMCVKSICQVWMGVEGACW